MNETQETQHDDLIERTIRDAGSVGKAWARYGLVVGKAALETSAHTLEKTATLLDSLATHLAERKTDTEPAKEIVETEAQPSDHG